MEKTYKFIITDYANGKGVICPSCNSPDKVYYIIEHKFYRCGNCNVDIKIENKK